MAQENYIRRISFLDGMILHDFHLNRLQRNFSEGFKRKSTQERYDILMLVSPYNYYFAEPFINDENRHEDSTADINQLTFAIQQDDWITNMLTLPKPTEEIYMLSNYVDDPARNNEVFFYFRTSESQPWRSISLDNPIYIPETDKIQIKVSCTYSGTTRPEVTDFALLFK